MIRAVPIIVLVLLAGLLCYLLTQPKPAPIGRTGQQVTQWQGKAVVVNVFASWCVPCAAEMDVLQQVHGIELIGVAYKDQPADTAAFLKKLGNPYTDVIADNGVLATQLAIAGVPETFLIDKTGTVRWHYPGPLSGTQLAELQEAIQQWR